MALKATIKIIKDDTGGGGIIKDDTGGGGIATDKDGSTAAAPAPVDATPIIKDDTGGGSVAITIVDDHSGKEYTFSQLYYYELCLSEGDIVRYDLAEIRGQKTQVVTSIQRVTVGTIQSIGADGSSGVIKERGTQKLIPFYQTNLDALRIKAGDFVRYDLIRSQRDKNAIVAVNLREVND